MVDSESARFSSHFDQHRRRPRANVVRTPGGQEEPSCHRRSMALFCVKPSVSNPLPEGIPYAAALPRLRQHHWLAMNGHVHVGDMVQLPSGLVFKVTFASDPARPWRAVQMGGHWRVSRDRLEGGVTYFYGGRTTPMKLNQADAEAVAAVLNRVRTS